ncbi:MAG TPA: glycosyltransferase [Caulobacterales bacterium]|nr:glycosyltransferase [Caulobacterales bacterium]
MSAVIIARHVGPSLDLCLRSALIEPWIDEVIVVDNANSAQVASALRALQADRRDVKVTRSETELGPAAAANLGAAKARGRWLLFLDPNVVLQRGAVARMAAAGGGAPAPWIVGGRLTDANGRERRAARVGSLTAWSALAVALDWHGPKPVPRRRRRKSADSGDEAATVAAVSAAFMLIPSADFHDLDGFDERFATDAADLDLCRRAGEAGGRVLFQPAASGVQLGAVIPANRREAQGLALFVAKSARTPIQRAFALIARPALMTILFLRDLIIGRPPRRRRKQA